MNKSEVNIIVGATSQIAVKCISLFVKRPGVLVLAGRNTAAMHRLAEENKGQEAELKVFSMDVRDSKSVSHVFNVIGSSFGRISYAFNNSGILKRKLLEEHSDENWNDVIDTNLTGLWRCLRGELPLMREHGGGIVNMGSVSSLCGTDWGLAAYTASKFGVLGITKVAALENAKYGVRVNAVCPSVVETDLTQAMLRNDTSGYFSALHPLGRICTTNDIADAVDWLCSERSKFVTGIGLPIDGGLTAKVM